MLRVYRTDPAENTPFNSAEQEKIAKQLRDLLEYAKKTYSLSDNDSHALEDTVTYLQDASGRLGGVDWRTAFVGALMAYLITAALAPDTAHALFGIFVRSIGQFFGYDIPRLLSG